MIWVPKVNKMSFWARWDKNLQSILWSVSSKCLKQAQGGIDMEYRSRKKTMTAVGIVFPWHLGPIQPSLTVGSSEGVGGKTKRGWGDGEQTPPASCIFCSSRRAHGLRLGECVWMDMEEERKKGCVCVAGHSGTCNYEVCTVIVVVKCLDAS